MAELVPGARGLRREIAAVVGIDRSFERHAAGDFDAGLDKPVELGRVVGHEHHAGAAQHLQHADRHAIVALVVVEAERGVGIDRVEACVLQLVGPHLVGKTDATALLGEIEDHATARFVEPRQRQLELIAAIAAAGAEHVAGQACRMDANRHRLRQVGRTDDHRDRVIAERIAEHDEARPHVGAERHMRFAGDGQRLRRLDAEARHGARLDVDDRRVVRAGDLRCGIGDQHRRQHLRELDQLDGRHRRRSRGLGQKGMIRLGLGGQRQDLGCVDVGREFQRHRLIGVDAKRPRAEPGQRQTRHDRGAQRAERRQAILVQPLDRQAEQRFAAPRDHNRTACSELRKPSADPHMRPCSKQN